MGLDTRCSPDTNAIWSVGSRGALVGRAGSLAQSRALQQHAKGHDGHLR